MTIIYINWRQWRDTKSKQKVEKKIESQNLEKEWPWVIWVSFLVLQDFVWGPNK